MKDLTAKTLMIFAVLFFLYAMFPIFPVDPIFPVCKDEICSPRFASLIDTSATPGNLGIDILNPVFTKFTTKDLKPLANMLARYIIFAAEIALVYWVALKLATKS